MTHALTSCSKAALQAVHATRVADKHAVDLRLRVAGTFTRFQNPLEREVVPGVACIVGSINRGAVEHRFINAYM